MAQLGAAVTVDFDSETFAESAGHTPPDEAHNEYGHRRQGVERSSLASSVDLSAQFRQQNALWRLQIARTAKGFKA